MYQCQQQLKSQVTLRSGHRDISYSNPLPPASLKDPYTREGSYDSLFDAGSENGERERGGIMSDGLGLAVENHWVELFGAGPSDNEFSE